MSYAKLGLDMVTVPAKIQYLRRLGAGVNANPNLPNPTPTSAAIIAKADELETNYNAAQAARLESKTRTELQDQRSAEADLLIAQLASYVDAASGGNAVIIESAGFEPKPDW